MKATKNTGSVTMPAGIYIVGDPCYAVPSDRWMEWLEAADYMNERRYLLAELDGMPVLGIGTAHGDGRFGDENGNLYPVDAGLIGLVPVELGTEEQKKYSEKNRSPVVTFDKDFECSYEDGAIRLGHIAIDTDPEEYFDE